MKLIGGVIVMNISFNNRYFIFKIIIVLFAITAGIYINDLEIIEKINLKHTEIPFVYILFFTALYTLILAVPYIPASEIGLCIILIFREHGPLLVYVATILGLFSSFMIGNHFVKNSRMENIIANLLTQKFYIKFGESMPALCLVILLNTPGNVIIGGGGGIALSYGMLRNLTLTRFLLTIAIGTAPVPLFFFVNYNFM